MEVTPPPGLFQERLFVKSELPSLRISILCAVTPIILMLLGALTDMSFGPPLAKAELTSLGIENITGFYQQIFILKGFNAGSANLISAVLTFFKFMSDANIALFMAVILAIFTLGLRKGRSMDAVMNSSNMDGHGINHWNCRNYYYVDYELIYLKQMLKKS